MGRIPKPKKISSRSIPEPEPSLIKPAMPDTLDVPAQEHWKETIKHLDEMGLLSRTDTDAVTLYCEAWSRYRQCEEFLRANGISYVTPNGYRQPFPERDEMYRNLEICRRYQIEFGLTPSARSRIGIQKKKSSQAWGEFFQE